jgi:tetratricopeptide (TPR) repeat protein
MPKEQLKLYHTRESTRHFLYSKAESEDLAKKRIRTPARIKKAIQSVYPRLLTGRSLLDHVAEKLTSATVFGCMVLRIDDNAGNDQKTKSSHAAAVHAKAAKLLNGWCKKHNGTWGLVDPGLFSSFHPEINGAQCLVRVRKFQKSLTKHTGITASAGIAQFPTLSYGPLEILTNARKALDHAAFFGPNSAVIFDAVSLNISGDQLFDKGDIKECIKEYKQALKLEPSNINVHNSLGVCYGLIGDYEKAKQQFNTATKLHPTEVMAWYNLGFANMLTGNRNKALDLLLKANTIDNDVFEVAFQTGRLLLEMDQPERSKKFLEHSSKLAPKSSAAFRYLGECYTRIGKVSDATAAYKKAIKQNPNDAASLSAMGCLFDEQDENPEISLMFCQESVKLSPENGLFRYRLGQLYLKHNRLDEALKEFKKADFLGQDAAEYITKIQNRLTAKAS